ncbi:hypothetical protein L7F22_046941 [Adiantum nelumboides]|nr:hypothetical protein [Adiantum nelumboides]
MEHEAAEQKRLSRELHTTASGMTLHLKRAYAKEFLLSVGELEECKRVPAGLDSSLLRGTQPKLDEKGVAIPGASSRGLIRTMRENDACSESPPDVPEWRRPSSLPGSPFLKPSSRQAELKISSPRPGPTRPGNNSARSIMGRSGSARWELRSNGDDRDRDNRNPFEWELSSPTESGAPMHNRGLARSGLVVSQEHDGLLGSGGPIVHKGMIQTPAHDRHRAERTSRIGRTGDQYHSTRGGKVSRNVINAQNSLREDTDSISDETFGSDDWPHGERSEQERQRRDQFEQMRKELRKKPLITVCNHDDTWLKEGPQSTETFVSSSPSTPQSASSKDDISKPHIKPVATSLIPRLLVPPGFSKPTLLKLGSTKENLEVDQGYSAVKNDDFHALEYTSSTDEVKMENEDHFSSLLMKLNQLEDDNQKSFPPSQSPMTSKFARWFPSQGPNLKESATNSEFLKGETKIEEESGLSADFSSAEPELAGGIEIKLAIKPSSVTSSMPSKSQGFVLPMPVGPSLEDVEKVMTAETDFGQDFIPAEDLNRKNHVLDHHHLLDIDDAARFTQSLDSQGLPVKDIPRKLIPPVFLTCEDLEQSLLSECVHTGSGKKVEDKQIDRDDNVNLMQLLQLGTTNKGQGLVTEQESGDSMDGNASTHLMTLLQKNAGRASPLEDSASIISAETSSHPMGQNDHVEDQCFAAEIISLETLFGRKFVNELRSVGEPVSSKQIVDDSMQENLLNSILFNKNQSRQPGHADVPFHEQAGWNYDGLVVTQPKSSEIISGSHLQDLQADLSTGVSAHRPVPMKALKNTPPSREVLVNGASFGDFSQRKFSHHPYHGSRGQQLEGHHHPPSEIVSHRSIHEPHLMQENPLDAMGMHAPNSGLLSPLQGQFLRAGNSHLPGHFEEASSVQAGIHRVVSAVSAGYPESIQMGFNPSQGMSDPRITGSRISPLADRWFPGDHIQGSQGIAGVNPYQHQMIQERKPGFGISGLGSGPGAQNYNVGLPSDRRGQAEKSYDHYILSNSRPGYG